MGAHAVECLHVDATPDGRLRIFVFYDDPDFDSEALPSAFRGHGTPLWPMVCAAVEATPTARSDEHGLWWETREDAQRALAAARKVLP